ncbi:hypothetical protein BG004_002966, partial [Podila humilis]
MAILSPVKFNDVFCGSLRITSLFMIVVFSIIHLPSPVTAASRRRRRRQSKKLGIILASIGAVIGLIWTIVIIYKAKKRRKLEEAEANALEMEKLNPDGPDSLPFGLPLSAQQPGDVVQVTTQQHQQQQPQEQGATMSLYPVMSHNTGSQVSSYYGGSPSGTTSVG